MNELKTKTRSRISLKELRETQRWLKLIQKVPLIKKPELLDDILQETEKLIKIFVASIKTAPCGITSIVNNLRILRL